MENNMNHCKECGGVWPKQSKEAHSCIRVLKERVAVLKATIFRLEHPNMGELRNKITEIVAQSWCAEENKSKVVDSTLSMTIVESVTESFRGDMP